MASGEAAVRLIMQHQPVQVLDLAASDGVMVSATFEGCMVLLVCSVVKTARAESQPTSSAEKAAVGERLRGTMDFLVEVEETVVEEMVEEMVVEEAGVRGDEPF